MVMGRFRGRSRINVSGSKYILMLLIKLAFPYTSLSIKCFILFIFCIMSNLYLGLGVGLRELTFIYKTVGYKGNDTDIFMIRRRFVVVNS